MIALGCVADALPASSLRIDIVLPWLCLRAVTCKTAPASQFQPDYPLVCMLIDAPNLNRPSDAAPTSFSNSIAMTLYLLSNCESAVRMRDDLRSWFACLEFCRVGKNIVLNRCAPRR